MTHRLQQLIDIAKAADWPNRQSYPIFMEVRDPATGLPATRAQVEAAWPNTRPDDLVEIDPPSGCWSIPVDSDTFADLLVDGELDYTQEANGIRLDVTAVDPGW